MRLAAVAMLAGIGLSVVGCAANRPAGPPRPDPAARLSVDTLVARLPAEANGFVRGTVRNHEAQRPGFGQGVEYTTDSRNAVASVDIYDKGQPQADAALQAAELDEAVRDAIATQPSRTGRRMEEQRRAELPVAGGDPLHCVVLGGLFGRMPVLSQICVGAAGGRLIKIQVTMPDRGRVTADVDAFATTVTRAARGA
jgi:hypothetical protein